MRIGHQEGPRVNDPRAPEWDNAVKRILPGGIKLLNLKNKGEVLTVLTEFGPPDY